MQSQNYVRSYEPTEQMRTMWLNAYGATTGRITVKVLPTGARTPKAKPRGELVRQRKPTATNVLPGFETTLAVLSTDGVLRMAFRQRERDAQQTWPSWERKRFAIWSEPAPEKAEASVLMRRGNKGAWHKIRRTGETVH